MSDWQNPPFRYPGAQSVWSDDADPTTLTPITVQETVVGRRVVHLTPDSIMAYYRQNELRIYGKASWQPPYGAQGTIVAEPPPQVIGQGYQVRWDAGPVTWLGSGMRYRLL